jgi:hypothetical protein
MNVASAFTSTGPQSRYASPTHRISSVSSSSGPPAHTAEPSLVLHVAPSPMCNSSAPTQGTTMNRS